MSEEFDVIVVGGGVAGGLTAGTYLQKAGAKVAIFEARHEMAAFCPTMEVIPNVMSSPHASGNFVGNSPAIEDLDLPSYGFSLRGSIINSGCTFKDGHNVLVYLDPEKTRKEWARYSPKDADRLLEIASRGAARMVEANELMFFSEPTPQKVEAIFQLCADVWGIPVEDFMHMNAMELAEVTFENDYLRRVLFQICATSYFGDALAKGIGAFALVAPFFVTYAQQPGGNHVLPHQLLRVFLSHGGTQYRNCPVSKILVNDNNEAIGVQLAENATFPGRKFFAKRVISNLGANLSLQLLGDDVVKAADYSLYLKMKYWKSDFRCSSWSMHHLKGRVPWKSRDWNPDIDHAHFFYAGFDSWQDAKDWCMNMKNDEVLEALGRGYAELVVAANVDPSQASPEGWVSLRQEGFCPVWWYRKGRDKDYWDEIKDQLLAERTENYEQLATGIKEMLIDAVLATPLDCERYNPVGLHGQGIGGDFTEDQWYLGRMPYRMPIKNLYMSNGVWPLGLTWLASGYVCADVVARDMGIRNQSWWTHRPCEWYFANINKILGLEPW